MLELDLLYEWDASAGGAKGGKNSTSSHQFYSFFSFHRIGFLIRQIKKYSL
jgi:hypothetical protein